VGGSRAQVQEVQASYMGDVNVDGFASLSRISRLQHTLVLASGTFLGVRHVRGGEMKWLKAAQ
jgi:hypothetical protein